MRVSLLPTLLTLGQYKVSGAYSRRGDNGKQEDFDTLETTNKEEVKPGVSGLWRSEQVKYVQPQKLVENRRMRHYGFQFLKAVGVTWCGHNKNRQEGR